MRAARKDSLDLLGLIVVKACDVNNFLENVRREIVGFIYDQHNSAPAVSLLGH
jgi:hypothetical protein